MLVKLFEKMLNTVLDFIAPPAPQAPVEVFEPEPVVESPPDPRQIAAQLRALADKIDPIVIPAFQALKPPYEGWNKFMGDDGTTGGKVKRAGCGVQVNKISITPKEEETEEFLTVEETMELLRPIRSRLQEASSSAKKTPEFRAVLAEFEQIGREMGLTLEKTPPCCCGKKVDKK